VYGLHHFGRPLGLLLRPEGDQVERAQRLNEAPPEIMSNLRVSADASGHQRMGHLQQHRRSPPKNGTSGVLPSLLITLSGAK
jgi:hypothetical protein